MDLFQINELCPDNIQCKNQQCEKKHPRCFAGLCIESLLLGEEECTNDKCSLVHLTQDQFEIELDICSINGIYRFNLCPKKQTCQQIKNCRFLHPLWANDLCIKFQRSKCKSKDCPEGGHVRWKELTAKVNQKYNIQDLNPENLCLQPKKECNCDKHPANSQDICIKYFKGICPLIECTNKHVFWEEFKFNFAGLHQKTLKPCTIVNSQIGSKSIVSKQDSQIFMDQTQMNKLKQDIQQQNIVDVILIMDCTKSMDKWLDLTHSQIASIIDSFKQKIGGYTVRIAFVGYRDVTIDRQTLQITNRNHVVFHDFTENVDKIKAFIKNQAAEGGGDEAEDVVAGLIKATELNISKHPGSVLVSFLFAEAPCHGQQYHSIDDDDQMDSVEYGTLEKVMLQYKKLKEKNYFTCVQIKNTTQQMYSIMQSVFPEITISAAVEPEDIPNLVRFSLHQSLVQSQLKKIKPKTNQQIVAHFRKSKYLPYCPGERKDEYWKYFDKFLQANLREDDTVLEIEEAPVEIQDAENGVNSFIFKLFDVRNNSTMAAKLPKKLVEEYRTNKILSEQTIKEAEISANTRFFSQTIAKQMARIYREKTGTIKDAPPIFYPSPIIYKLQTQFMGLDYLYAETYIDLPNIQWLKYSNNSLYIDEDYQYFSSFSHFTFEESGRLFTITDLQGKKNILSDPSLQTNCEELNNHLQEDTTNRQLQGIGEFLFGQHKQCNPICSQLGLYNLNEQTQLNQSVWKQHESEVICIICETCDEYRQISVENYEKLLYKKCMNCIRDEKTTHETQCQCCCKMFQSPVNLNYRLSTILNKCPDCKVQCQKLSFKCHYCGISCQLKIKDMNINDKIYKVCIDAKNYLFALKCTICESDYAADVLLSAKEYTDKQYKCIKCQNK